MRYFIVLNAFCYVTIYKVLIISGLGVKYTLFYLTSSLMSLSLSNIGLYSKSTTQILPIKLITFYPNRVTIIPERSKQCIAQKIESVMRQSMKQRGITYVSPNSLDNLKKKRQSLKLSKSSKKKMLDSINSMYCLSKSRKVRMKTGKYIYNFKCSFITLTLPSSQQHSDIEIKKECLNQLLVELRKKYGIKNYVWKAELQKNDNIHFHLVVDKYVDYQALRYRWNRIINKLGYVKRYAHKMQSLSLSDYARLRKSKIEDVKKAYAVGKKYKWSNPNSVDVRSVRNDDDLAIYLAKYLTKAEDGVNEKRILEFGRLWYRSQSLSRLKYINRIDLSLVKKGLKRLEKMKDVRVFIGDYFKVISFRLSSLPKKVSNHINMLVVENAKMYNYPFPDS